MRRLFAWLALMATALSQLLNVFVRGPLMVFFNDGPPDPDETLSSVLGRRAADGRRWAGVAAFVVDVIYLPVEGWRLGHCARAAAAFAASRTRPGA